MESEMMMTNEEKQRKFDELVKLFGFDEAVEISKENLPEDICNDLKFRDLNIIYKAVSNESPFKEKIMKKVEIIAKENFNQSTFMGVYVSYKENSWLIHRDIQVKIIKTMTEIMSKKIIEEKEGYTYKYEKLLKNYKEFIGLDNPIGKEILNTLIKFSDTGEKISFYFDFKNHIPDSKKFITEIINSINDSGYKNLNHINRILWSSENKDLINMVLKKIDELNLDLFQKKEVVIGLIGKNIFRDTTNTILKIIEKMEVDFTFSQWMKIYEKCKSKKEEYHALTFSWATFLYENKYDYNKFDDLLKIFRKKIISSKSTQESIENLMKIYHKKWLNIDNPEHRKYYKTILKHLFVKNEDEKDWVYFLSMSHDLLKKNDDPEIKSIKETSFLEVKKMSKDFDWWCNFCENEVYSENTKEFFEELKTKKVDMKKWANIYKNTENSSLKKIALEKIQEV